MRLTAFFSAALLIFLALPSQAQDLPISAFFGTWKGSGLAENADSVYFAITARDFDVVIEPDEDGFTITWTTIIHSGGAPADPDIRRRQATLTFEPSDQAGVFEAQDSDNPLEGGVLSWARISGDTLSVYQMTLNESGGFELTSYDRTLNSLGMELEFRRLRDGEEVRKVTGRLIKMSG